MRDKTEKIVELAKEKSEITRVAVIEALDSLKKTDKEINFSSVAQEANVSRNYLYTSEEFRPIIEELRERPIKYKQTKDTKDLIIETQKKKITELEERLKKYESFNDLEKKYNIALNKIKKLENQLKKAYKY